MAHMRDDESESHEESQSRNECAALFDLIRETEIYNQYLSKFDVFIL